MRIKVHVAPQGESLSSREALDIACGEGNQILQWLAHAACARLAHRRGEALGCYVPQAVLDKDGRVLDIDLVLSEAAPDGGELVVEYGCGPLAFTSRWEGRPKTPPFSWSDEAGGERVLPHDAWLAALDLSQEGAGALQEPEFLATDPAAGASDLARVKEVLVHNAGALQMLFLLCTADASTPVDAISRMTLAQLKALLAGARVMGPGGVTADSVDRAFAQVLSSPGALARKADNPGAAQSTLDLPDFFVALVHVAHLRFSAESFASGPSTTPLSTKLLSLLQESLTAHVLGELQRKLEKLRGVAVTPGTTLLLRKGRRLTEQVLDRCQLKRVKARVPRVDLRHVCKHLQRWGLLGKEFGLPDLAPVAVFAKQQHAEPHRFALHPWPLALDYDEVERLLLGTAHVLAWARKKRTAGGGFEEFLGEFLDTIYKRSGVLVDAPAAPGAAGAAGAAAAGPGLGGGGGAAGGGAAGSETGAGLAAGQFAAERDAGGGGGGE